MNPPKPKPLSTRISRRWLWRGIIATVVVLAFFLLWTGKLNAVVYSIQFAVPAGKEHLECVVAVAPDWKRADPSTKNFNSVPHMTRGYCYAQSQAFDTRAPGGFGRSNNAAHWLLNPSANGLYLLAQPEITTSLANGSGMRVVLVNATGDLLSFSASDSRLNIIQEAQDKDGNWKPIEYLPRSWCGNSHHRVFLGPNHFWAFAAPRYQGKLETVLRFTLTLHDGSQIVSNTFSGSVNLKQFTDQEGHAATNIMDSYDE